MILAPEAREILNIIIYRSLTIGVIIGGEMGARTRWYRPWFTCLRAAWTRVIPTLKVGITLVLAYPFRDLEQTTWTRVIPTLKVGITLVLTCSFNLLLTLQDFEILWMN
jgi:hypothetical protein